jgi:hypothetical protein
MLSIVYDADSNWATTTIREDLTVTGNIIGYYSQTQVDQMFTALRAEMAATYALKT